MPKHRKIKKLKIGDSFWTIEGTSVLKMVVYHTMDEPTTLPISIWAYCETSPSLVVRLDDDDDYIFLDKDDALLKAIKLMTSNIVGDFESLLRIMPEDIAIYDVVNDLAKGMRWTHKHLCDKKKL